MKDCYKIILLGLGGQGVLFAGKVLAHTAFLEGYKSTFIPTYGPEVQNGPVKAEVIISREAEIYNPFIEQAGIILVFHKFRLAESKNLITPDGVILGKDFQVENQDNHKFLTVNTEAAEANLNQPRSANIIMLGALAGFTGLFEDKSIGETLKTLLSHRQFNQVSINFKAYKLGKEIIKNQQQANVRF